VSSAADIGCGPGNSTELLQARYPNAVITAIDSSPDMIEASRKRLPGIRFEIDDIALWRNPGPFDVILANATLQWLPDHKTLLPDVLAKLADGGSLAVQIPDNLNEPAHRLMREIAAAGPWAEKLSGASKARAQHSAGWYYRTFAAPRRDGGYLANHLLSSAGWWGRGCNRVVQGHRPSPFSRSSRRSGTVHLLGPLRNRYCTGLSGFTRRYRASAVSETVFCRDNLTES